MSKPDSPRGLRAADALLAEAQIERVAAMTEPELDEALRSQGLAPDQLVDLETLLPPERAPKAAPVAVLRPRPRWNLWLVAASFAALGVCAVVAALRSTPTNPGVAGNDDGTQLRPSALTSAQARAETLRGEAERACRQELWGACNQRLEQAKALDPDGEGQERVRRLRTAIAEHQLQYKPGEPVPDQLLNSKTGNSEAPRKP